MRLPADAVLLVINAQGAPERPRNNLRAEENIAALLAAWRAEGLPVVHARREPAASGSRLGQEAGPRDGEISIETKATSAFVDTGLEDKLDELGVTTLVLCGPLASNALDASARHAGDLGYQVFVVADACWAVDKVDVQGKLWPAEDVHAPSLAHLRGDYATLADTATTLRAAAVAKFRQRHPARKP